MKHLLFLFTILAGLTSTSCKKTEGCMDNSATNYDTDAEVNCEDCCLYPALDTTSTLDTNETDSTLIDSSLYHTTWNILTAQDKWYWRASTLLTYSCTTDSLTDSTTNFISNASSYTQYQTDFTGLFQNGSITNNYQFCALTANGETLMVSYDQNPSDTIFYKINTLNDSVLDMTANSEWCALYNSYYFQTEVLKSTFN